ncbi:hypothetical protein Tco_1343555 [Tanacetum coccineum]
MVALIVKRKSIKRQDSARQGELSWQKQYSAPQPDQRSKLLIEDKRFSRTRDLSEINTTVEHARTSASSLARVAEESALIWLMTRGIVDRVVTSACPVVIAFTGYAIMPKLFPHHSF